MSIVEGSTSESGSKYSSETEDFQVELEATSCGVDESASTGTVKPKTTWNPTQKNP